MGRIHAGRFGSLFFILANIISYKFNVEVFQNNQYNKTERNIVIILSAINIVFQIFIYQFNITTGKANQILEIIAFILILLLNIVVWIPFIRMAFKTAERIEEKKYRNAFRSLGFMTISFIGVIICFILDRLMLIIFNWVYSVFYFIVWIFALVAIANAYFGYIKPKNN